MESGRGVLDFTMILRFLGLVSLKMGFFWGVGEDGRGRSKEGFFL